MWHVTALPPPQSPQISSENPGDLTIAPPLPLEKIPVDPHRLDAARILRFRAVHQVANRINLQRLIQRMPHRHLVRFTVPVVVLHPPVEMSLTALPREL